MLIDLNQVAEPPIAEYALFRLFGIDPTLKYTANFLSPSPILDLERVNKILS
jgi:hypothetical protein